MSEPIKITRKEVKEWILKQPDERPIDFSEFLKTKYNTCGCLMIQYADYLELDIFDVGTVSFHSKSRNFIARCDDWQYCTWGTYHKTFKTLKEDVLKNP